MSAFLISYGTGEGQTATIAERIVDALEDRGHSARAVDVADPPPDLDVAAFDAVIVGASIHMGHHQSEVTTFVEEHADLLASKPTAFFQVSLSSATEEGEDEAAGYVEAFLEETGWHPDRIAQFGGALRFSEYGFLKRLVMKRIAKDAIEGVDTSRDTEFTDWDAVDAFADDVAAFVEGRLAVGVGGGDEPERG